MDRRERASREGAPIEDLGDGLLLRHAAPADSEALIALNGDVHKAFDATEPDHVIADWTRDLLERPHPAVAVDDFMVVEDTRTGQIASTLNLISQTWSYGGELFGVGRIELVGTHPDYRRRGLVRRQFEVVHRWSAERGELVQAITGIPWYYRQFGYEYALAHGDHRPVVSADIPRLAAGEVELYRVRPATRPDVGFLMAVMAETQRRYLVTCVRDQATWCYELDGRGQLDGARAFVNVVEDAGGEPIGYVIHEGRVRAGRLRVSGCELKPGVAWTAVAPCLLRYVRQVAGSYAADPPTAPFAVVVLGLGADHPLYPWLPGAARAVESDYTWYIRVADLPAFIRQVAPAIEARLAASGAAGLTSEARLNFYRSGLRLVFENGRLRAADVWPPERALADASFPDLTFLQVLFGYRSFEEVSTTFPDCYADDPRSAALVDVLFPKQPSLVWPVS